MSVFLSERYEELVAAIDANDPIAESDALAWFYVERNGPCMLARHLARTVSEMIPRPGVLQIELEPQDVDTDPQDALDTWEALVSAMGNGDQQGACELFHTLDAPAASDALSLLLTTIRLAKEQGL